MAFNIREWLENFNKNEILFLFQGDVSGIVIAETMDYIELKLEEASPKVKKKIFNVMVECIQNLFHHALVLPESSVDPNGKFGVCILSQNNIGYQIISGNFVKDEQKTFLTKHLDHINTLDKDALKNFYKEILDNQEFSAKGGGGLGMVDISRKSGSRLNYKFEEYTDGYYFFTLDIAIIE